VLFERNSTIIGVMDERGRFPGAIKFEGEAMYPKALVVFGTEKSFISLFIIKPVSGTRSPDPKRRLIVLVRETVKPDESAVTT
jgi:hypothetical protein